jgi:putative methionine-R-sulfoxide reductase with GAF domain
MTNALADTIKSILGERVGRQAKALRIAEAIRNAGAWRWVGLYTIDYQIGMVVNLAWSGPGPPEYPSFAITKGLTSRALANGKPVNVGDVASDPDYLTALGSTRSEIIIPVMDKTNDAALGTIDVESESVNAFDTASQTLLEECASVLADLWSNIG